MLVVAPEFGSVADFGWIVAVVFGSTVAAAAVVVEGFVWQLAGRLAEMT